MKKICVLFFCMFCTFVNVMGEVPAFQPKSVKEIDFERCSRLYDSAAKKFEERRESAITDEESAVFDETKESFWDVIGYACSWYCAGGPSSVTASSSLKSVGDYNYDAKNAHDLDYQNAWVEGVAGYGVGESLTYKFAGGSPRVTRIIVVNGYVKSAKAFKENSRVKKLKVYKDEKAIAILELKDIMGEQTFEIGTLGDNREGAADWTLKFEILEVYEGGKYDDTAISEIYFEGIDVHCLAKGTKIAMADGSEKSIEDIMAGDEVLSYSFAKGVAKSSVKAVASKSHSDYVCYKFKSGKVLICTPDHPLLSEKDGWVSYAPEKSEIYEGYDKVSMVKEGMSILSVAGADPIISITKGHEEQYFYTIEELCDGQTVFYANGLCVGTEPLKK